MEKERPLLVVLTPVRNEAWILRAFLSATSLWADYIIIADQMSTDGSREIINSYHEKWKVEGGNCKVIMIENNREDIHMAAVRSMLMEEARKIPGDKILVALDADEFWAGDFMQTEGWKKMMNSEPDDVFEFKWMNLCADMKHYLVEPKNEYFNWVTHISDDFWTGDYPEDKFIHEWRLRWSPNSTKEKVHTIDDLQVAHFCHVNTERLKNKWRYYAVSSIAKQNSIYNIVNVYRQYNQTWQNENLISLGGDLFDWYKSQGVDVLGLIDLKDAGQYYVDRVLENICRDGVAKYAILDIWNNEFCEKYHLQDPRNIWQKMVHGYLRLTKKYADKLIIRGMDKIMKRICNL